MAIADETSELSVLASYEVPRIRNAFDALSAAINRLLDKKAAVEEARKKVLAHERDPRYSHGD